MKVSLRVAATTLVAAALSACATTSTPGAAEKVASTAPSGDPQGGAVAGARGAVERRGGRRRRRSGGRDPGGSARRHSSDCAGRSPPLRGSHQGRQGTEGLPDALAEGRQDLDRNSQRPAGPAVLLRAVAGAGTRREVLLARPDGRRAGRRAEARGQHRAVGGEEPRGARAGRHAAGGCAARELLGQPARVRCRRVGAAPGAQVHPHRRDRALRRRPRRRDDTARCRLPHRVRARPSQQLPSSACGRPSREPSSRCASTSRCRSCRHLRSRRRHPERRRRRRRRRCRTAAACSSTFTYTLAPLPAEPMRPRLADQRVGHFTTAFWDFANSEKGDARTHYIERWRLEKKDALAPVSEPKEPILVWMDKNIPEQYREAVKSGILEWNKAFEKAGFRNAIEVRQQPADAEWSTLEGTRHLAVRWFAQQGPGATAVGPRVSDPRTGEILLGSAIIPAELAALHQWLPARPAAAAEQPPRDRAGGLQPAPAARGLPRATPGWATVQLRARRPRAVGVRDSS